MHPCDHTAGLPCPRHHIEPARSALSFWRNIAKDNEWTVSNLTVWVDGDRVVDSVATRDGQGRAYVVDNDSGEVLTSIDISTL